MLGTLVRNAIGRLRPVTTPDQVRDLIRRKDWQGAQAAAARLHPQTPKRIHTRTCLESEIAFRQGRDAEAEAGFKKVLGDDPGNADAHYGLSLLLFERGDGESALRHAQFASNAQSDEPRYLAQLGLCHVQLGNYPIAERILRAALRALPEDKSCWNNMGIVQAAKGDQAYARQCFQKALEIDPQFESARANLDLLAREDRREPLASQSEADDEALATSAGAADAGKPWLGQWQEVVRLHFSGDSDGALRVAERIAAEWPDDSLLAVRLGKLYALQGDAQGGIDAMQAHLQRHPQDVQVLAALGKAHAALSELKLAEAYVREAVRLGDESSETLGLLGEIVHLREEYQDATEITARAVAKAPKPGAKLIAQLAAAQVMACRYDEALATYARLFEMRGRDNNPAIGGYTLCLTYLGRFDEAEAILDNLLLYNPNEAGLRTQRFQLRLLRENFGGGWDDYIFRGLADNKFFRVLPFPRWQGEPLEGKRIIVLAEQGLGDQVMLASCLPDLLALGPAKVYVEAIHRVAPTLARSFPECTVIPTNQDRDLEWVKGAGDADFYVPLGDLPARFRRDAADFPRRAYLRADPGRVQFWKDRIRACGEGPYIGVSWRGGTQVTRKVLRSFTADMLAPLAASQPATWINLQYGEVEADIAAAAAAGMHIHHWPEAIADLDEFAALITALDAVVTVCNTTVHYAGALGRKTWVLAPQVPEWRYGLHFRAMPWYPDVTVLRQEHLGDWEAPLAEVTKELTGWVAAKT